MSGERQKIRFGRSWSCSMNSQITKISNCVFVSCALCMSFPLLFHLLTPQHLPLLHLSPAHLFSTSQNLKLSFPQVPTALPSLCCQLKKKHRATEAHSSVDKGTLTLQQTKKEEIWALSFSFSVWESGILQNWMTLVQRFKSYWRGANRLMTYN